MREAVARRVAAAMAALPDVVSFMDSGFSLMGWKESGCGPNLKKIVKSRSKMLENKAECAVSVYGAVQADHAHGEGRSSSASASLRRTSVLLGTLCVACCMVIGATLHWVSFLCSLPYLAWS